MKVFEQTYDQPVFGHLVKTFPNGIGEAFGALMKTIPDGDKRSYYGLSKMDDRGAVLYWVAAEEKFAGEAERYGYERFTILKGNYLSELVPNWKNNLACIKDVFHQLMQDDTADTTKHCIEWYYAEDEMLCMIQKK